MRADPIRPDVGRFSELGEESKRGMLGPVLVAVVVIGIGALGWMKFFGGPSPSAVSGSSPTDQRTTAGSSATSMAGSQVADSQVADTQATETRPPAPTNAPPVKPDTPTTAPTPPKKLERITADAPTSSGDGAAVHEEIPNVSAASRNTIRGHVRVAVRVTVDNSGRVVRDALDNPSPSNYFNRVASEAARKWRFASADRQGSREWLLRFEFGRDGTTVRAVGPRS